MTNKKKTVRDVLGDPASWPSKPADFALPNEHYLLARFLNAVPDDDQLIVHFDTPDGQIYRNTFKVDDADQAHRIAARVQLRGRDLLLDVMHQRIDDRPDGNA